MGRRDAGSPSASAPRPAARLLVGLWPLFLAVVILAPLLVTAATCWRATWSSSPRQPLTDASVGLGGAAPRAVPLDAVVSVATVVRRRGGRTARPLLALVIAGWGMLRLTGPLGTCGRGWPPRGFAVWNPFVVERMAWVSGRSCSAYAALPWMLMSAAALRRTGERRSPAAVVLLVGAWPR